jgi:hypothetical protein
MEPRSFDRPLLPKTVGLVENPYQHSNGRAERIWYAVRPLTMSPWRILSARIVLHFPLSGHSHYTLCRSISDTAQQISLTPISAKNHNARLTPKKAIASPWPSRPLSACSWLPQQQRVDFHAYPGISENTSQPTGSRSNLRQKP